MAEKTILEEWKDLLSEFNSNVDKSLKDIRQYKRDIEKMKVELVDELRGGQFIRDEECIVISAPRIIIGNVTKDGVLKEELGDIIIRGHALEMDGVGNSGSVRINAPVIEQRAIDTGLDGKEAVVYPVSDILHQARNIVLDSQDPTSDKDHEASFLREPVGSAGICLNAEKGISVVAAPANEKKKEQITQDKQNIESAITDKKKDVSSKKKEVDLALERITNTLKNQKGLADDDELTRSNILAIDEIRYTLQQYLPAFSKLLNDYAAMLSELAELNRKKQNLLTEEDAVNSSAAQYKESTGSSIYMQSERIAMHAKDGDNTWRTNDGAGVEIRANDIKLHSTQEKADDHSEILPPEDAKGKVSIQARSVNISTADATNQVFTDDHKLKTAQFPLVGNVTIRSKIIDLESVDLKQTDETGKLVEEKLTEGSQINMRAEKVRVKTIDHEGKSVGKFSVNSQKISMKATNIENYKPEVELDSQGNRKQPTTMKSKELAQGSEMLLLSGTVNIGYKNEKMMSEKVDVYGDNELSLGSLKDTSLWSDGAHLDLKPKQAKLESSNTVNISGSTLDVSAESSFKGKITGGDIVTDNLTANKAVKTPNITDGVVVAGAPSSAPSVEKKQMQSSNI